jgi:RsiW-degrading membrane proteinase PrsW (M82 family)
MNNLFYIIIGTLPSIIWLLYFLRKDVHPESNRMVIKIFLFGVIAAPIAALIEMGFFKMALIMGMDSTAVSGQSYIWFFILYNFLGIALVEEFIKYSVVRLKVLGSPEFDEPTDAMLYMIIAALGFAAIENVLYLLPLPFFEMLKTNMSRFLLAIFLHALCSGLLGYFLALALMKTEKRKIFIISGLIISTILHGLYNISIITTDATGNSYFTIIPIAIIIGLAFFVSIGFKKLKRLESICKIK